MLLSLAMVLGLDDISEEEELAMVLGLDDMSEEDVLDLEPPPPPPQAVIQVISIPRLVMANDFLICIVFPLSWLVPVCLL